MNINLIQFRDIIKNLQNDDTLSITKDKYSYLWKVCFNNCEKNTQSIYTFENNIDKIETIKLSPLEFSSELRMDLEPYYRWMSLKKMNPLSMETLDLMFTNYGSKISCQNKDNSDFL